MKALTLALIALMFYTPADKVISRFIAPSGYTRLQGQPGSFAFYLQNMPLKPAGTHTKTFDGKIAQTDPYTAAVIDLSLGDQDLQQCADAVMRLRGEYLYGQKRYADIMFHFESGFKCDYINYADGYRYYNGKWVLKTTKNYSYATFLKYMNLVFAYAGTLSLEKELKKVNAANELKPGDVFIHGGSPGHCFIVMDVAENNRHQKVFLLAQSFMPAQDIQLLKYDSAWFAMDKPNDLPYGELISIKYLKNFD